MQAAFTRPENLITNGFRARQIEFADLAVRISDLASTASTYFRVVAVRGSDEQLALLAQQAKSFAEAARLLQQEMPSSSTYRSLIPSQVWREGIKQMPDMAGVATAVDRLMDCVAEGSASAEDLRNQSAALLTLARTFQQLASDTLQSRLSGNGGAVGAP